MQKGQPISLVLPEKQGGNTYTYPAAAIGVAVIIISISMDPHYTFHRNQFGTSKLPDSPSACERTIGMEVEFCLHSETLPPTAANIQIQNWMQIKTMGANNSYLTVLKISAIGVIIKPMFQLELQIITTTFLFV